jgi:hypothetical protein
MDFTYFVLIYAFIMFYRDALKETRICLKYNKEYKTDLDILNLYFKTKNITIDEQYSSDQSTLSQQLLV